MSEGIIAVYVWIDGENGLRSKERTLYPKDGKITLSELPEWNYDGSSTKQAEGKESEVILKPCAYWKLPLMDKSSILYKRENDIIVMCSTYKPDGTPIFNNHYHRANEIFEKYKEEKPWYGLEQEFFFRNSETGEILGLTKYSKPQGEYYCGVGGSNMFGRKIMDEFYRACLYMGIKISGINAEVAIGQWEYQIGPAEGIQAGNELWITRYLLRRIAEKYNVDVDFEPKPLGNDDGDWNGSGCHTNFSTKSMREGTDAKSGLDIIYNAINKLEMKHKEHMDIYGTGNEKRMTGKHETAHFDKFSYGVGNRGASVRIPTQTLKDEKGYFEDRRPSSNMDPYLVTSKILETSMI